MKKNDFILIGAILILALLSYGIMNFWQRSNTHDDAYVEVKIDGQVYATYPLNEDRQEIIETGDGEYNTLVIKDGQADITEATCPDKICVKHRGIHYSGESIACLPHKLSVTVVGGEDNEIDATTN